MDIDGWTGTWHLDRQRTFYENPMIDFMPIECRVRAEGHSLWMEQDWPGPDGALLTWRFDGAMDGVMRPIIFVGDGSILTDIAFYLLDQNFGGDTNRRPDGSYIGCEYWRLDGDDFEAKGVHNMQDGTQHRYAEFWRRAG